MPTRCGLSWLAGDKPYRVPRAARTRVLGEELLDLAMIRAQDLRCARAFRRLASEHRGEATAEVLTARPLNDDQLAALKQQLRARAGREVNVDATVDPSILGGIVVKLGSQRIDASIRTKLNRLALAMKG